MRGHLTAEEAKNLNIANLYYNLKDYNNAIIYDSLALEEYLDGKIYSDPSPVSFIEDRLATIKKLIKQ